jgi:hypothetical protein
VWEGCWTGREKESKRGEERVRRFPVPQSNTFSHKKIKLNILLFVYDAWRGGALCVCTWVNISNPWAFWKEPFVIVAAIFCVGAFASRRRQ